MKFSLIALSLCFLGVSCERHDFEETKQLHQGHGTHDTHGGHGDDHGAGKKAGDDKHGH
jgi:hypothetical protein